jgi:phospholipid/cholesterol/gamma-HCH transport system ATP-binding protein
MGRPVGHGQTGGPIEHPGADRPAIEFADVHTSFGEHHVLRGVSFALPRDRISVLIGPSGVGKSTCIRHLAALYPPDAGEILVEGRSVWGLRKAELAALQRRFGFLLQGKSSYGSPLFASLNALDNVYYQLRATTDLDEPAALARARERLGEVGLADHAEVLPDQLSSGMRTRLALARATAADPDFVVLDGFELGIDSVRLAKLCELVRARQRAVDGTYLVVTQDMDVARRLADHLVVLLDGRIRAEGPAAALLDSTDTEVRQLVTGAGPGRVELADADGPRRSGAPPAPAAGGYELPLWLLAAALLGAITTSALVLGAINKLEIAVVIAVWVIVAAVVFVRLLRS